MTGHIIDYMIIKFMILELLFFGRKLQQAYRYLRSQLYEKNLLNLKDIEEEIICQLVKKLLNLIKKEEENLRIYIIKNLLNPIRKQEKKLLIYYFVDICYFVSLYFISDK